jgi:hypothetical protein
MAISQTLFTAKVAKGAKEKGELIFAARFWRVERKFLLKPAKPVPWRRKIHGNDSDPSLRFGISRKR